MHLRHGHLIPVAPLEVYAEYRHDAGDMAAANASSGRPSPVFRSGKRPAFVDCGNRSRAIGERNVPAIAPGSPGSSAACRAIQ
jgi:hypothetical protein